jgi:hypothetical protein
MGATVYAVRRSAARMGSEDRRAVRASHLERGQITRMMPIA